MLSFLDASIDLPPGRHHVTVKTSIRGQALTASGEFDGPAGSEKGDRERLARTLEELKECEAKVEKGRQYIRERIQVIEKDKAGYEERRNAPDTTADTRAELAEQIRKCDVEIADWKKTLGLLQPSPGSEPEWIGSLKFFMAEKLQHISYTHLALGQVPEAKARLEEAKKWDLGEKTYAAVRAKIALQELDFPTHIEMVKKSGLKPDFLHLASLALLHKNDVSQARQYIGQWKRENNTDEEPVLDLPPPGAKMAD
jgi:hypothetical protein